MNLDLRPMSTGQVLDRTFFLYRNHFWLFAGIAATPPAFLLVAQLIGLLLPGSVNNTADSFSAAGAAAFGTGAIIGLVLYLIGYALATGASVYAVSRAHLGQTTTIAQAYQSVKSRVRPIIGITIGIGLLIGIAGGIVALIMVWFSALVVKAMGLVGGIIMFVVWVAVIYFAIRFGVRYTLAVPACVLEKLTANESMSRSFSLAQGAEGRLFVVLLINTVIAIALAMLLSLPAVIATGGAAKGAPVPVPYQIMEMVGSFLANTISGPISIIAFSLVYYDQRVRKEAFDLTLMMEAIGQAPAAMQMGASAGTPSSIG